MSTNARRGFTGRHMTAIMIAFFGVVVAVIILMARLAIGTFGGVVVENSYVASQHFNRWLDEAAAEKALGWSAEAGRAADGRLSVTVRGLPPGEAVLAGMARHPLGRQPDQALAFAAQGGGRFLSLQPLPTGRWRVRLEVQAAGTTWRAEEDVQ